MRSSSNSFITHISSAKSLCSLPSPHASSLTAVPEVAVDRERYTLSTLVSLLLSVPESVYRSLEANAYLDAALLEGLGKVVYNEFVSWDEDEDEDDEDEEEEKGILKMFPLVEKQWERLKGLGDIVGRRARSRLSSWKDGTTATAETLVALVLLDSNSIPESLDLLLSIRSKALQTNLAKAIFMPDFSTDEAAIQEALELILVTSAQATQLFIKDGGDLLRLLERIQKPSDSPTVTGDSTVDSVDGNPNSIVSLLHSLPSSHLLLRYLPPHILSFTPFIDTRSERNNYPSPAGALPVLERWMEKSQREFGNGFKEMIAHIRTGKQLFVLKQRVEAFLLSASSQGTETSSLLLTVQRSLKERLAEIYSSKLAEMVEAWKVAVGQACEDPAVSGTAFLFDPKNLNWPPAAMPTALFGREKGGDPFELFRSQVRRKIDGRFRGVEGCVRGAEEAAMELKEDLRGWLDDEGR
ncbi:hypothetical protein BT69DRAFT_640967 [Atractiella rhizophila]|nr:hypothetical protein BT69DRAFT_640967 [Atractiella rhizophila]